MTTEMIVNVSPRETRAALLENGVLQELFLERASRLGLTGNLYKGRVSRVLPGMQAAFIDIGLERTAFLHVSDIVQPADAEGSGEETRTENIRELVSEGGDILVQVLKDPLGTKGARLTTFITIPGTASAFRPASRPKRSARGCAIRCTRAPPPASRAVTSCAPRRKAPRPRRCVRTCSSCASCGASCRRRPPRRAPARSCTKTCRCPCA
jgi:hypothetical protein